MARGTTRQILADIQHLREHPSPVHVTRSPDAGMVQIAIAQPPDGRTARETKTMWITFLVLGSLALLFALLEMFAPAIAFAGLLGCMIVISLWSYDWAGRAYVIRVGREQVVVASSGPLGARYWECPRDGIRDVRIVSGKQDVLLFDLTQRRSRQWKTFALGLHRDLLIEVTEGVREGLALPKRSWP